MSVDLCKGLLNVQRGLQGVVEVWEGLKGFREGNKGL